MIRLVLDTNVVVSAALSSSGPPFRIIELANQQLVQLWISAATFVEYEEVLSRPKIGVPPGRAKILLAELMRTSEFITPAKTVSISSDPDDNMFLECAEAAKAHYLVTGNIRHFPERWKYTKIVTPRQFVDLLGSPPRKIRR